MYPPTPSDHESRNQRLIAAFMDFVSLSDTHDGSDWLYQQFLKAATEYTELYSAHGADTLSAHSAATRALTFHELKFKRGHIRADIAYIEHNTEKLEAALGGTNPPSPAMQLLHAHASACQAAIHEHLDHLLSAHPAHDPAPTPPLSPRALPPCVPHS
jgi:hypothetical protein